MLEVRRTTGLSPLGSIYEASASGGRRVPSVTFTCLDELTPREHEVATLLARGYSNKQIAQSLVLTQGTVANHVAHILSKLGVTNRTQVAALILGRTDEATENGSVVQLPSRPDTAQNPTRMRWSHSANSPRH
jgi:DNA-binding CsgD family transcriptional regulator